MRYLTMIVVLGCLLSGRAVAAQSDLKPAGGRSAALTPLYGAFVSLQALDIHSSLSAIGNGGREANPVVRGALSSPPLVAGLKAGVAAGVIVVTERLSIHHAKAAVLLMTALNSAYAAIVARNYTIAHR